MPKNSSQTPSEPQSGNTSQTPPIIYPIQPAWLGFVKSVQILLVPQVDDRPLDQYLALRDKVLELVQEEQFLASLNDKWAVFSDEPKKKVGDALILELEAFPRAVEVAKATENPEDSKKWWTKLMGQASTVSGSVKDLMGDLPAEAKMALTLLKELFDLFKG